MIVIPLLVVVVSGGWTGDDLGVVPVALVVAVVGGVVASVVALAVGLGAAALADPGRRRPRRRLVAGSVGAGLAVAACFSVGPLGSWLTLGSPSLLWPAVVGVVGALVAAALLRRSERERERERAATVVSG